jgi:hypothetical protein
VFHVRYGLGFYIPEDGTLLDQTRLHLKSTRFKGNTIGTLCSEPQLCERFQPLGERLRNCILAGFPNFSFHAIYNSLYNKAFKKV